MVSFFKSLCNDNALSTAYLKTVFEFHERGSNNIKKTFDIIVFVCQDN